MNNASRPDPLEDQLSRFLANCFDEKGVFDAQQIRALHKFIADLPALQPPEALTLREFAFRLWNKCVEDSNKVVGLSATSNTSDDATISHVENNARARQVACAALCTAIPTLPANAVHDSKCSLVRFYYKTGALFACISRQSIAQQCWESSIEFWDTMEGSEITSTSPFEEKTRQDAFGASCCLMEWHLGQLKIENGLNYLRRAESLAKGPEQYKELAKVAMESGSKLVSDDPTSAMAVLEKSSMFHEKVSDKVGQAKALRNIARCCIQLGDLERALNAAKLAATLQSRDQYSILLLLRVQLLVAELDGAASTLRELILLPISTCDAVLAGLRLTMEKDLGHLAAEGCNLARSSSPAFAAAPGQVEKVMLLQLEILVTLLKDNASGIKLLDDILETHNSGSSPLTNPSKTAIFHLCWEAAKQQWTAENYTAALEWLHRSTRLLGPADAFSNSQALCMIANCFVKLGNFESAAQYAQMAIKADPTLATSHVVLFEAYVRTNDDEKAIATLNHLASMPNVTPELVELCAHVSENSHKMAVFIRALELALTIWNNPEPPGQICRIGRRLLQELIVSSNINESSTSMQAIHRAAAVFSTIMTKCASLGLDVVFGNNIDEALWLRNTAWNVGRMASKPGLFKSARACFETARRLSPVLPDATDCIEMSRECLVMEGALTVMLLRESTVPSPEVDADYRYTLSLVEEYRSLSMPSQSAQSPPPSKPAQDEQILLLEVEAHLHIPESDVVALLDNLQVMVERNDRAVSFFTASTWDKLASIVSLNKSHQQRRAMMSGCMQASLRHRLKTHDLLGSAEMYRRLIEEIPMSRDDEVPIFQAALKTIREHSNVTRSLSTRSTTSKGNTSTTHDSTTTNTTTAAMYPQRELEWLLVHAHNNGVYFFRLGQLQKAESWLVLAISLMDFFSDKSPWNSTVMGAYDEVLRLLGHQATASTGQTQLQTVYAN